MSQVRIAACLSGPLWGAGKNSVDGIPCRRKASKWALPTNPSPMIAARSACKENLETQTFDAQQYWNGKPHSCHLFSDSRGYELSTLVKAYARLLGVLRLSLDYSQCLLKIGNKIVRAFNTN